MFFELREYHVKPGQRENWQKWTDEEMIPFCQSKGMVVVGSFVGKDEADQDLYIWIPRFESEAERDQQYKDVYGDPVWENQMKPKVAEMLDLGRVNVRNIEATPKSVSR